MCVPVGNATADTEFSFEYGVKKSKSKSQKQSPDSQKGLLVSNLCACVYFIPSDVW